MLAMRASSSKTETEALKDLSTHTMKLEGIPASTAGSRKAAQSSTDGSREAPVMAAQE
jgi:hypothetical protein